MGNDRQTSAENRKRIRLRQRIVVSRMAILAITAVSLLNLLLLLVKVNYHFHLSAAIPYYMNWLGLKLSDYSDVTGFRVFASFLTVGVFVFYVVCWLFSSQRSVWLSAALVMYAMDTLLLIILSFTVIKRPGACVFEILAHMLCLWILWSGVSAGKQLRKMGRRRRVAEEQPA